MFSDELLIRTGRAYSLSHLSNTLRPDLAEAIGQLRTVARAKKAFDPAGCSSTIKIACNDYLSSVCIKAWAKAVLPFAPKIQSSWRPLEISVINKLASGEVDLVLIPEAARANLPNAALLQDLVVEPIFEDVFVVFGSRSHPQMKAEKLSLKNFAKCNHILVSPEGTGAGFIDDMLNHHGLRRHITYRTFNFMHAADIAIATENLAVLPQRLAYARPDGDFRPLPFKGGKLQVNIAWHASRTRDKTHSWVRNQLRSFFK